MKKILFAALAMIVVMASCVKDPQYPGVTISNVSYNPAVQADVPVTVTANITSFNPFTAYLYYTIDTLAEQKVEMTHEGNIYSAAIPGNPDGTKVSFYIVAEGTLVATSPTMEYEVGAVAVDYSVLRLNELNGHDKFIELYNTGANPINLKGVYIEKDNVQNWVGDASTTIDAGGYLLLYGGDDPATDHPDYPTNLFFNSGLSAKKNVRIQIFTPAGESIDDFYLTNISLNGDTYGYHDNQAPASYSRNTDGEWYYSEATPNAANVDGVNPVLGLESGEVPPTPVLDYANLVLNELNGNEKYIEFYNKGDVELPMENMYLMKDGNDSIPIWTADATVVVPAHGYVVIYGGDDPAGDHPEVSPSLYFNSGLSPKKVVRIALFMPDSSERDVFVRGNGNWGDKITDVGEKSFSRTPDGGADWKLTDPTLGTANPDTGDDIPQD